MKKTIWKIISLCLMAMFCTASACEDFEEDMIDVWLENKSEETIWVKGASFTDGRLISPYDVFRFENNVRDVKPEDTYKFWRCIGPERLEQGIEFQIIVFKQSTIDKYTTEELIEQEIFDKRYSLSYDDLKAMDYKVVYTGE